MTGDVDGDGDPDVFAGGKISNQIIWFENLGNAIFGPGTEITNQAFAVVDLELSDVDGDGDLDLISAAEQFDRISWYANLGNGSFGAERLITFFTDAPADIVMVDLDGDWDLDLVSASFGDDKIACFKNDGSGGFSDQVILTGQADGAAGVHVADFDGDGDPDIAMASALDDTVAWIENLGSFQFDVAQTVWDKADYARSVHTGDLDGDGDADIISASSGDNTIAWYSNPFGPFDCDADGISDQDEIKNDPSLDWNGDGILDSCLSPNYCKAAANASGLTGRMGVTGTPVLSANDITLLADQVPTNRFGLFLLSSGPANVSGWSGSVGSLCLNPGALLAAPPVSGTGIVRTDSSGRASLQLDLSVLPPGSGIQPGDRRYFQFWFRDTLLGFDIPNLTDGIEILFR